MNREWGMGWEVEGLEGQRFGGWVGCFLGDDCQVTGWAFFCKILVIGCLMSGMLCNL